VTPDIEIATPIFESAEDPVLAEARRLISK
jgi:hypothetical protein